jgi:HSP20 family protein
MAELLRGGRGQTQFRPAADVYVSGEPPVINIELDAAGIDPEAVRVTLDGDVLTIEGERRRPVERRAYQHAEIDWGRFERGVRLPAMVDIEQARADYEAGLLTISLPVSQSRPSGPILISVSRRESPRPRPGQGGA